MQSLGRGPGSAPRPMGVVSITSPATPEDFASPGPVTSRADGCSEWRSATLQDSSDRQAARSHPDQEQHLPRGGPDFENEYLADRAPVKGSVWKQEAQGAVEIPLDRRPTKGATAPVGFPAAPNLDCAKNAHASKSDQPNARASFRFAEPRQGPVEPASDPRIECRRGGLPQPQEPGAAGSSREPQAGGAVQRRDHRRQAEERPHGPLQAALLRRAHPSREPGGRQ